MGGSLSVTSEAGEGSCFHIRIPAGSGDIKFLSGYEVARPGTGPTEAVTLSGRVLVAEDTRDLQIIIGAALKKAGLEVRLVNNGQQAVDLIATESFDLILLDIEMPVLDGVSAFKAIRANEQQQGKGEVPILALTAHAFKDEVSRLEQAGFNEVITKPFQRRAMLNTLTKWLSQ